MKLLKSSLLASAAGFAAVAGAQAADLPVKKAAPIEYVRVCSAYGAGFFYIPGTDTCIRLSGRARFEVGYAESNTRTGATNGDTTGYRGLARINVDARTQTAYGTLRAFTRLEFASRTGSTQGFRSGTQERIANAFGAQGQDQVGRVQQFVSTEKAFIQFAGLTAGRASSFFDFYAQDFELQGVTGGSNLPSTNLIAYTTKLGSDGFSATISVEDPSFRRNTIFSPEFANGVAGAPYRLVLSTDALGTPTFNTIDVTQKNKLPDFVGVLRYDAAWGSAQLSAAVKEVNTGNFVPNAGALPGTGPAGIAGIAGTFAPGLAANRSLPNSEYGWAVQGGVKINLPFIAPGDTLYLQGAYGEGATLYTGYSQYNGSYVSRGTTIQAAAFDPYQSDAAIDPLTHKIQLSRSFTVVGSVLHYWAPEWRSAFFGSYGELSYGGNVRANNARAYANLAASQNVGNGLFVGGLPGSLGFSLSPVLRDNYEITAGASLIWSPVKDLDIGVEGAYINTGVTSGRVIDQTKSVGTISTIGTAAGQAAIAAGLANGTIRTVKSDDVVQVRMRVQRDF